MQLDLTQPLKRHKCNLFLCRVVPLVVVNTNNPVTNAIVEDIKCINPVVPVTILSIFIISFRVLFLSIVGQNAAQRFAARQRWRFLPQMYLRSTEPPLLPNCRCSVVHCLQCLGALPCVLAKNANVLPKALAYPILFSPLLNISFTIPNSIAEKSSLNSLLSEYSL